MKLIYILSPSYSGSTLLTFLLSQHADIASIGEVKGSSMGDVENYRCSCGELIKKCGFWNLLSETLASNGIDFDVSHFETKIGAGSRLRDRVIGYRVSHPIVEAMRDLLIAAIPSVHRELDASIERNLKIMDAASSILGSGIFLDGSKDPIRLRHLCARTHVPIKVIRLVRDGRGTTRSFMKNENMSIKQAATAWKRIIDEVNLVYHRIPEGSRITVRYEDLCSSTEDELKRIWAFLGVDDCDLDADVDLTNSHIIGNRMRLAGRLSVRLDEKWREELSKDDLRFFEKIGGARNAQFAYV